MLRSSLLVLALVLSSSACRTSATAFVGAHVLAADFGRFLPDQTVLVVGDVIERVGPTGSFPLPPGTRTIDARGKWLIPELADAHGTRPTRRRTRSPSSSTS